jgi:hypothetical protein
MAVDGRRIRKKVTPNTECRLGRADGGPVEEGDHLKETAMTKVLLLQLIAALAFALAVSGPEVAMTFEPSPALADGGCNAIQPLLGPVLTPRDQLTSAAPRTC